MTEISWGCEFKDEVCRHKDLILLSPSMPQSIMCPALKTASPSLRGLLLFPIYSKISQREMVMLGILAQDVVTKSQYETK